MDGDDDDGVVANVYMSLSCTGCHEGYTGSRATISMNVTVTVNARDKENGRYQDEDNRRLYLNAWIDGNHNGSWNDSGEHFLSDVINPTDGNKFIKDDNSGTYSATFHYDRHSSSYIADIVESSDCEDWIRVRLSYAQSAGPEGGTSFGEVEDYKIPRSFGVDFVVSDLDTPVSITTGVPSDFSYTITNQGGCNIKTKTWVTQDFGLSQSPTVNFIGQSGVWFYPGDISVSGTATLTIPPTVSPGTYNIVAIADSTHEIAESNETNNTRAAGPVTVITTSITTTTILGATTTTLGTMTTTTTTLGITTTTTTVPSPTTTTTVVATTTTTPATTTVPTTTTAQTTTTVRSTTTTVRTTTTTVRATTTTSPTTTTVLATTTTTPATTTIVPTTVPGTTTTLSPATTAQSTTTTLLPNTTVQATTTTTTTTTTTLP